MYNSNNEYSNKVIYIYIYINIGNKAEQTNTQTSKNIMKTYIMHKKLKKNKQTKKKTTIGKQK